MELADRAKKAIEKKMNVQATIRSEHFLFTVLRDYNFIRSK